MAKRMHWAWAAALALFAVPATASPAPKPSETSFTIAVIPDTQTYLNFHHQKSAGFPFDAARMMDQQFDYIAQHSAARGGDIRFVAHVGDIWEHATLAVDPVHIARGFKVAPNPVLDRLFAPTSKVTSEEIPAALNAFAKIEKLVPFGVAPGNHDYDAMWTDSRFPPYPVVDPANHRSFGVLHIGGLDSFRRYFGDRSPLFADKPWYVAAHDGGADSAQTFTAGGYRFLHIALQFNAPKASLDWAAGVMARHKDWPTIITTHDYLSPLGERASDPAMDSHAIDPEDGSPQILWDRLIRRHDQIFLVLCGHQSGEARRRDNNAFGHSVDQLLADYQDRRQASIDAGVKPPAPIGDGWMRLLRFDMRGRVPTIQVRTYSPFYGKDSRALGTYAAWYKTAERPDLTDAQFLDQSDFTLRLDDFRKRFGPPRRQR